jgi:hypothetical protein
MWSGLTLCASSLAGALLACAASGATVVAQHTVGDPNQTGGMGRVAHAGSTNSFGQTFTPTQGGPFHSVDLYIKSNGPTPDVLRVSLWPVDQSTGLPIGIPGGTPLASVTQTVTLTSSYSPYTFDFAASGVTLVAGTKYCWMLNGQGGNESYDLRGTTGTFPYPGGASVSYFTNSLNSPLQSPFTVQDFLFVARVGDGGCAADFNQSGGVTVQDIFDFLTAWNADLAAADFNQSGGVTVQDIFDFLAAWNAGC